MPTVLFDTLKVVESLKSSGFTEAQAKGLSEAFKVAQETSIEGLATKDDIKDLKGEILRMETRIESTKAEIIKWVAAMLVAQSTVIAALVRLFSH